MTSYRKRKSGFTLVELLVSTTIIGMASAIMMSSFIFLLKAHTVDQGKLLINRDIRKFTNDLADTAAQATTFTIFNSFTDRTPVRDAASGDFLLLEFRDTKDATKLTRIVGFYRAADAITNRGPVQTFDLQYTPSIAAAAATLTPAASTSGNHTEVVQLSAGLSNGRLFQNFRNSSIVVRGELIHNNGTNQTVSNTYNFTVSPRG
jgi:prepilin-type N-terminal cleavage/methylation domain-containing protein